MGRAPASIVAAVMITALTLSSGTAALGASEDSTGGGAVRAPAPLSGRIERHTFQSAALGRQMPYLVYLPPSYDESSTSAYATLYLLHGMGGTSTQWRDLGIARAADRLITSGAIAPLVIVMPEGENAYWVDHAGGSGVKWGRYTAVDVVQEVESTFRVTRVPAARAIGGLSMGAHGALQLALNYPGEFAAVGAHSLVLRRHDTAPSYFGSPADFSKRDPMQLAMRVDRSALSFALWIDIGEADPWTPLARQFDSALQSRSVAHQWHVWPGDHSAQYWSGHLTDYLRFYGNVLDRSRGTTALSD